MSAETDLAIVHVAAALYGLKLGSSSMDAVRAAVDTEPRGAAGLADRLCLQAFGDLSHVDLARQVVDHLRLRAAVEREALQGLADAFAADPSHRGQVLIAALQWLAAQPAEAPFGPDGARFAQRSALALQHAGVAASADAAFRLEFRADLTVRHDRVDAPRLADAVVQAHQTLRFDTLQSNDELRADGWGHLALFADAVDGPVVWPYMEGFDVVELTPMFAAVDTRGPLVVQNVVDNVDRLAVIGGGGSVRVAGIGLQSGDPSRMVIALDRPDNFADHAFVYRDPQPVGHDATALRIELMDLDSATLADPGLRARPLAGVPYNGFSFMLGDERVTLKDAGDPGTGAPLTLGGAQTYDELLQAVRGLVARPEHLARWPALAQVQVAFGPDFVAGTDAQQAVGRSVQLSVPVESTLSLGRGTFVADEGTTGQGLHHVMAESGHRLVDPTTVRIEIVQLGDLSYRGGDLWVGADDGEGGAAITRLEMTVERASRLGVVAGVAGDLREVVVANGLEGGSLEVEGADGRVSAEIEGEITVPALPGMDARAHGSWGFTDLRLLDFSGMRGDVTADAVLSARFGATYAEDPAYLAGGARYRGGQGNDTLEIRIDAAAAASPAFHLTVAGGDGDDGVRVLITEGPAGPLGGRIEVEFGPGEDGFELVGPRPELTLVLLPDFGNDTVWVHGARLTVDTRAIGGTRFEGVLAAQPARGSLVVHDGAVIGTPQGGINEPNLRVEQMFTDSGDASARTQLVVVETMLSAEFWEVHDGPGAMGVSTRLVGTVRVFDDEWGGLGDWSFG